MPEDGFPDDEAHTQAAETVAGGARPSGGPIPRLPERIGPFRIVSLLGEGGMGRVYEAEQDAPRRTVALKVVKPGVATGEGLQRFERESQVLGRLQHPGIAAIYQAGTADTGLGPQPYFAMEFVRGHTLLEYADAHHLTTRQRVELMARICDAVQHAHQKGVIHRDLKPGNLLVDESGQPKVLDFGVARVTDGDLQATLRTDIGQLVGTIPYMSPEQVQSDSSGIDTRSDVYALGVVLYQLLTGRLPYEIDRRSALESVRAILEEDPTPLSTIHRSLKGDVETIVLRALEKERDRRYASAAELAADLRRYLANEPILAHAPSTLYQLKKFARRNRVLVGGVAAVIVALALGLVVSLTQVWRATRAERLAREEADKARAVNAFLQNMLGAANPASATAADSLRGRDVTVVQVLDEAGRRLDRGELAGQPRVEAEARRTLGATYREIGAFDKAGTHLARSLALREAPGGGGPLDRATSLDELAWLRQAEGNPAAADTLFRASLALRRAALPATDTLVVRSIGNLAAALQDEGLPTDAEPKYREVLALQGTAHVVAWRDRADALSNLGKLLQESGRPAEADSLLREALALRRRYLGARHPEIANNLQKLSAVRVDLGDRVGGEKLMREAAEMWRQLLGENHPYYATALANLGQMIRDDGRLAEAEPMLRQAIVVAKRAWGENDEQVAAMQYNYARLLQTESKLGEAETEYTRALAIMEKTLPADHPSLAAARSGLGSVRTDLGRPADGEPLLRQALATYRQILPAGSWQIGQVMSVLGGNVTAQGRYAEAEKLLVNGYALLRDNAGTPPDRRQKGAERLVALYTVWNARVPIPGKKAEMKQWQATLSAVDTTRAR